MRRLLSLLSVCVVASATVVSAAPKKDAKKPAKGAMAPAKDAGSGSGSGSAAGGAAGGGSGSGSGGGSGDAVQMTEDAPPADMNGVDENPDAPRGSETTKVVVAVPQPMRKTEYPIEEALRPITLPQNMSEVSIDPHAQVGDGSAVEYAGTSSLRARYGITNEIQIGLTYVFGGIYDDPNTLGKDYGFHPGKAVGLDVTYMLQKWVGVKVGVPVYVQPVAVSIAIGVPMKFQLSDKVALGGMDDLLNIKVSKFAPSFYSEQANAIAVQNQTTTTQQSDGHLRLSAYGIYQYHPDTAIVGRFGIDTDFGAGGGTMAGTSSSGGTATFLRGGVDYTPRRYFDIGGSLGFDDLGHIGSFGPALYVAVRI